MDLTRNTNQRNTSWNAPYTFSGKEKDAETGYGYVKKLRFFSSLAFGNEKQVFNYAHCLRRFGARYYDSGLSIWLSVDPMSDKYPSMSPYNYCANNPVMLVDPDGRDLTLSGLLADAAFALLVATNPNIKFKNTEGVITAEKKTNKRGREIPLTSDEQKVFDAINDHSIKINLDCTEGKSVDIDGKQVNIANGGAFLGNKLERGVMIAKQGYNPNNAIANDIDVADLGLLINHEITEAHQGAIYSRDNGGYAPAAMTGTFGRTLPNKSYQ